MDITRLRALPGELRQVRDQLRVVGYELVRYTDEHAQSVSRPIRHPARIYEYGFHKISGIYPPRVVIESATRTYCSCDEVSDRANEILAAESLGSTTQLASSFFKDSSNVLLTVVVAPYALAMLGLAAAGNRGKKVEQERNRELLPRLSETPEFQQKARPSRRS